MNIKAFCENKICRQKETHNSEEKKTKKKCNNGQTDGKKNERTK